MKRCEEIPAHPNLAPGWSCCSCKNKGYGTYNGIQRKRCKQCGHLRCDIYDDGKPN